MLHMLTEPILLFLISFIILRPYHRTLHRAVDVIAAVHYLNVMGYCDTLCPASILFIFFFISCCLLFLNLPPGFTLAIFKNYLLSSKLVCLCAHTPPTVQSFYHWIWSQLESLILLWQFSRIKLLLHHICSHLSISGVINLEGKYDYLLGFNSNIQHKMYVNVWFNVFV